MRAWLSRLPSALLGELSAPERRWRYVLLAAIVAFFAVLKGGFGPGLGRPCTDGNYYFQIARNVAEGHGFSTNVSLYNQGLRSFPHPINQSPLWPLTLGLFGALFGLPAVAEVVPEILFCGVLVLLYVLTLRVARRTNDGVPATGFGGGPLDVGHLVVLLFATNVVFFKVTSTPYTEGLAFFCSLAALIAVDAAAEKRCLYRAALAGALAGMAFLTRTQMIGVALALSCVLALHGLRERRFFALAGAAAAGMALCVLPWFAWIASWADVVGWQTFSGMGSVRETGGLKLFRQTVAVASMADRVGNVRDGLAIAFSPTSKDGYLASFGAVTYAVPLALLAAAGSLTELKRVGRRLWSAEGCLLLIAVLATLLMLAPLHLEKRQFFRTWLFGWRHGLPFILPIALALPYLFLRGERLGRALAGALVAITLFHSVGALRGLLDKQYAAGPAGPEAALVAFLDAQKPRPRVITTNAQVLSAFSRSYFHWMDCKVSAKHTRLLLQNGAADHVLLYPKEASCPYFAPLREELELVKSWKRGFKVELWRPKVARLGAQR
jgi:hypothetical protein